MSNFIIAFIITCFFIFILKGVKWFVKETDKLQAKERAEKQSEKHDIKLINNAIDNRGYKPYDGHALYENGKYSTIIIGNKDFPITRFLDADSIEELQKLADPLLEERREAWIKRINKHTKK